MAKYRFKTILTIIYSAVIGVLLCILMFFISSKKNINLKESFFLIGLVLVLIGIVILITKNPLKINALGAKQKPVEYELPEDEEEAVKPEVKTVLLGFNSFTVVLVGVFFLIVDLFLK